MPGDNPNDKIPVAQNDPTRQALGQQAFSPDDSKAAPSSKLTRYADVTAKGLEHLPEGVLKAGADAFAHPLDTAIMVGESAALGAVLKTVLPKGGPAGLIAGAAIGGYFMYEAAKPIGDAYSKAGNAKTMGELNAAGNELGDAGGAFVTNSVIAMGGYRLGAGAANKLMMTERMDGFAEAKNNFWNGVNNKLTSFKIPGLSSEAGAVAAANAVDATSFERFGARSLNLASNIKIEGERANLLYTDRPAPKASLVGDVQGADNIAVTVLAKTKGSEFLMDRYIQRIANGAKPLTDAEIEAKFGTDPVAAEAVHKFAADHNLSITDQTKASGRFVLEGSAEQMQKAFGTTLQQFQGENGELFRGRSGTLSVPTEVAPHIRGVLGLDNRPQFHTNYVKLSDLPPELGGTMGDGLVASEAAPKPQASGARPVDTQEVMKAYGADPKFDGKGMTTGFLSLGGTMPEGWNDYLRSKGIDPKTFETVNIAKEAPTPDPQGANGENALDGVIHKEGLPKAKTVMIQAPNDDTGMPNGIDRMTFPKAGESQISHASISWGMYEPGWTDQALSAMEDAGKRAALKGITITVAAGDNGAGDGWRGKKQVVDQPAGLKYFTGVGGTQLILKPDGTYGSEKVWSGNGATGGGRSLKTPVPDYQEGVKMPDNMNNPAFKGRGVPDIAANGDPRSGWNTFTDDGVQAIGGTSASAPAEAVAAAVVSQGTGKPTGFWNPTLYRLGKSNPEVYRDVTIGNNTDEGVKGYSAGPGWDATTGWGSVNISKMIDVVNKENNQHFVARGLRQVPGMIRNNHTEVPFWAIPYQSTTVNDQTK
ncbi:MAG: S8 family serine peptidase [Cyanobacteria bacterium SZAS LIN-5]|nr:S8 family serine peptidase [Cyanobacteria bacterium SZAS LIN-5]